MLKGSTSKSAKGTKATKGTKDSDNTKASGPGRFADINATVQTPEDGIISLTEMIRRWVGKLPIESNVGAEVVRLLLGYIMLFPYFNTKEEGKVVEAWGVFWAYRGRKKLWSLKVIWDFDGPSKTKDGKEDILPHYGYEIYLNGTRITPPGPGHVYITGTTSSYWRNAREMREIKKDIYVGQEFIGEGNLQVRLDHAMRLWGLGVDCELFNPKHEGVSVQEYKSIVHKAPASWDRFEMPSFGRPEDYEDELRMAFNRVSEADLVEWRADLLMSLIDEEGHKALEALR